MMHQPWMDEKSGLVTVACWRISEQETFSILPLPSKAHYICSEKHNTLNTLKSKSYLLRTNIILSNTRHIWSQHIKILLKKPRKAHQLCPQHITIHLEKLSELRRCNADDHHYCIAVSYIADCWLLTVLGPIIVQQILVIQNYETAVCELEWFDFGWWGRRILDQ